MSKALIVIGESFKPAMIDEAEQLRAEALESSALVAVVKNVETKQSAVAAQVKLATVLKAVESSRKAVKEPFLEACRAIDGAAKTFVKELEAEQLRVAKLVGDYDMELLAEARRKEAERQEELRRIADAEAAERRRIEAEARAAEEARQAEARRQEQVRQAELQRIAADEAKAKNAAQRKKVEEERAAIEAQRKIDESNLAAKRAEDEKKMAAELKRREELAAQATEAVGPERTMEKVSGQKVTPRWTFEVKDIWLLARMHPGFVRIEPNTSEINQALAQGVREIKGLRVFEEVKSGVRTNGAKLIEV